MKKHLNIHPSKVWDYLYPVYAKEFWQCNTYEQFARCIQNDFNLTPDQWGSILTQWELREYITQNK